MITRMVISPGSHGTPSRRGKARRAERQAVAAYWATRQGGAVHRAQLRAGGVSRHDVRDESSARRWKVIGRWTIQISPLTQIGRWCHATFEVGRGAVLDGVSALQASGLENFTPHRIDISVPTGSRPHRPTGVTVHVPKEIGPTLRDERSGLSRVHPARAAVRAALWADSARQAVTILAMAVQQRVVEADALAEQWHQLRRGTRRDLLDEVIADLTDGAHSLGELDFAAECRRRGLPEPTRQRVLALPGRTAYLDVDFGPYALTVEIDGFHHQEAAQTIEDALRQNEVTMRDRTVLRIPVLGFRTRRSDFMEQLAQALRRGGWDG